MQRNLTGVCWQYESYVGVLIPNRARTVKGRAGGGLGRVPRPGHADLAGMLKYDTRDARDILVLLSEVTRAIVGEIEVVLSPEEQAKPERAEAVLEWMKRTHGDQPASNSLSPENSAGPQRLGHAAGVRSLLTQEMQ